MRTAFLTSTALTMLLATTVHAQPQPGVIDRPQEQPDIPGEFRIDSDADIPRQEAPERKEISDPETVLTTLREIRFSGNDVLSTSRLQEIAAPYLNQPMTERDLESLKYDITVAYFDAGYSLVRVVTPPQSVDNGVLKMRVYEAKIDDIVIESPVLSPYIVRGMASRLESGQVYNEALAESVVTDLEQLPGIRASATLRPGETFNTSDLVLRTEEGETHRHRLSIDNYGSELTGETVATADFNVGNLLHLGEELSLNLRRSEDDLWSIRPAISVPTGIKNTILNVSYLRSENEIGDRLAALDASGETDALSLSVSGNLLNTRQQQLRLEVGVEGRRHESFLSDVTASEDDIRQAFGGVTYYWREPQRSLYVNTRVTQGFETFGASEQGDALNSRLQADPNVTIIRPLVLGYYRPRSVPVLEDGTFRVRASGQYATNAVLSSDLFIIGGYGTVRGFDLAQETGDSGFSGSISYAHDLPIEANGWRFSAGPFYDVGHVYNRLDNQTLDNTLQSAGIGFEATGALVPEAEELTIRLDWARTLGDYDNPITDNNWFYFRVSQRF